MLNTLAFSSLDRVSSALQSMYQMRMNRIHKFKPKVQIFSEVGPFVIKTVTNIDELKASLMLRYQVFHREFMGKPRMVGLDIDAFDSVCDHLVIIEKKTGQVVGTYRMNCSLFSEKFYSGKEFNLKRIMDKPYVKLELGRACIHRDYRRGSVISLLWRGIAEYMNASNAQVLFGCGSVKTKNPREAALLYRYFFEDKRISPDFFAPPTLPFTMPNLDLWIQNFKSPLTDSERAEAEAMIPTLLRTYLKIGAKIGGEPAWDEEFQCIDFLTIVDREDLNKALWKKYKLNAEPSSDSSSFAS
ncbi:MAG: GNAT family N-acetyltransferase [Pseudobdellovibrionaceae bacterium]